MLGDLCASRNQQACPVPVLKLVHKDKMCGLPGGDNGIGAIVDEAPLDSVPVLPSVQLSRRSFKIL
eukprot:CAMPEP_0115436110 /NCGR_PEP_ID=MMETSP0271-20121206/34014_1 /TAXON_ID=71861 /ORGANISM="Scrippsiella trochoidea, Strain CCMP3099" /LENGTH=65 /DNA_ID=CAMNT_0002861605 /DNA_START=133 /DNA_END=330 /DNA_ORIENTATION=+